MAITHPQRPNPDGVEVALGRLNAAQDHYLELQRLWREYCKRVESRVEIRLVATLNRAEYVWHMSEQPSAIMATQARASISEARSALDNLVYGLAQASGAGEPALRAVQFPVTRRRRDWADAVGRCLQAVPVKYHDPIADTQPFSHPRYGHVAHPLEFLQRSHNADKHHAPITLGVMPFFPPWTKTQIGLFAVECGVIVGGLRR